jgi:uroporphyrinogen-III synthase
MSLLVLILRPVESARETANRARDLGLVPVTDTLFAIKPLEWDAPPAQRFDALMLTSTNAVKYAGQSLKQYKRLPVLAVGKATAAAAEKAGLIVAHIGSGGAQALLDGIAGDQYQNILHLTGAHHVGVDSSQRNVEVRAVYQSNALPLGEIAQQALNDGALVLLHSPRAGETLPREIDRLGLDRATVAIAALSENIAEAAGTGWKSISFASPPTDDALLSLASALCRKSAESDESTDNLKEP